MFKSRIWWTLLVVVAVLSVLPLSREYIYGGPSPLLFSSAVRWLVVLGTSMLLWCSARLPGIQNSKFERSTYLLPLVNEFWRYLLEVTPFGLDEPFYLFAHAVVRVALFLGI